ncbi:MAG TPA: lysophospholipid acyltransferase family protein [Candidatus Acidoferrales bacterium]|nr:lysophospholipid acyltransferase family protein [Candidatus Acidoferrales bacterium]
MKKVWLTFRSLILWAVSGVHFGVVCMFLVFLGVFIDPRKNDWPQRVFFRNILRFAGVQFEVRRAPGFDPKRTSIFICNHVNIFDPFVIYSAIPQFVRGFELESHFKVPIYGWMMGRFGNVPVPDARSREGMERMTRKAKEALDSGVSLIAFAEGSRTRDGHVQRFHKGAFRIAQRFGTPIVPISIVGSYQFFQTGNWILYPGKITVYLHDTIETADLQRADIDELAERVRAIVAAPVEESLKYVYTTQQASRGLLSGS